MRAADRYLQSGLRWPRRVSNAPTAMVCLRALKLSCTRRLSPPNGHGNPKRKRGTHTVATRSLAYASGYHGPPRNKWPEGTSRSFSQPRFWVSYAAKRTESATFNIREVGLGGPRQVSTIELECPLLDAAVALVSSGRRVYKGLLSLAEPVSGVLALEVRSCGHTCRPTAHWLCRHQWSPGWDSISHTTRHSAAGHLRIQVTFREAARK